MSASDELQVLIVGGGIGGLTLAGFLRARGIEPVLVERRDSWDGRGYGLALRPAVLRVADALGIGETVRSAGEWLPTWTSRAPDGAVRRRREFDAGRLPLAIGYDELHRALREPVPESSIRAGTTLEALERSGPGVTARLSDGVSEPFDVVVGADGARSDVRGMIDAGSARFCGTATWSFIADVDGPDAASEVWGDAGVALVVLPLGDRAAVQLVASVDEPGTGAPREELRDRFGSIEWFLPEAMAAIADGTVRRSDDYRVRSDTWREGRVVLLGDAVHAVPPIAGVGATLAMGDAEALADELTGRRDDVDLRLADYVGRRRSLVRRLRWRGRRMAGIGVADSALLAKIRDAISMRPFLLPAVFDTSRLFAARPPDST